MTLGDFTSRRVLATRDEFVQLIKQHKRPSKTRRLEMIRAMAEVRKRREREAGR